MKIRKTPLRELNTQVWEGIRKVDSRDVYANSLPGFHTDLRHLVGHAARIKFSAGIHAGCTRREVQIL